MPLDNKFDDDLAALLSDKGVENEAMAKIAFVGYVRVPLFARIESGTDAITRFQRWMCDDLGLEREASRTNRLQFAALIDA